MKKYFVFASAALFALASCNKEPVEAPIPNDQSAVLTFSSERPQLAPDTKTQWNGNAIVWSSGDRIRVGYTLNGTWMAKDGAADFTSNPKVPAKLYASNNVSIDGTNASIGAFTVPSGFTNSPSGDAVFYGVYPSTSTSDDSDHAPSLTITIPSTQTPVVNDNIASFDKSADILVGKTDEITLSGSFPSTAIEMNWTRVVAHADLTFKNLAETISSETIQSIKLTAGENEYLTGSPYIDVGTGAVTTNNSTVNTVTLDGTNLTVSNNQIEAWACILPVTLSSLTVDIETDAAHYVKTFNGISKQFKANARNTLGIKMSGAVREEKTVTPIANGNYVLAVLSDGNYYAISSVANGNSTRRDRSGITTANFNPADYSTSPYTAANNLIWTITNVTGGVTINLAGDTGSYMQYGGNSLPLGSASQTFAVSSEVPGTYRFTPQTGRAIAMNGTYGFGCYATGNTYAYDFYLIPATGTPSLTFTETSKSVSAATTSVAFKYASLFLSADPTITVTEDNGDAVVYTSIVNSSVTVTLNENTTASDKAIKLKVSYTGFEDIVLTITQFGAVGDANDGDVLWAEAFAGFTANDVPSVSNVSTTVYGHGTVNYICADGGTATKVYTAALAGGVSPELLVSKDGGSFTASGVPTGNARSMTLSFKANNGNIAVSTTTANATLSSNIGTATAPVYVITVPANTKTLSLTFTNSDSGNTRIDDISIVAGGPVAGISVATSDATNTSSTDGTTATLNGTITLENGALISDVTEAGFYYKLSSASSYTKVTLSSAPATTSFSYDLTGLTKDSEYMYYAYAIYDGGSEITGSEQSFTPTQSGAKKEYTLTISASDFNTTSYDANNNEKTSNAVASDNSTFEVKWTSYQVMKNGTNMQWQKNKGYIYNSTDLGTIKSVTVTSSAGSFTTYYGTSVQPSSGTTVGNGFFKTSVGSATGTTSSVVIVFEK